MGTDSIVIKKKSVAFAAVSMVLLALAFAAGSLFSAAPAPGPIKNASLNDADRNFLVSVADSQVRLSALASDWCTSNGGTWNESSRQGELEINRETADSLKANGMGVRDENGSYFASVVLMNRDGCIFPTSTARAGNVQ